MKTQIQKHKTTSITFGRVFAVSAILINAFNSSLSHAGQAEIDQIEAAANTLDVETLTRLSSNFTGYDKSLAKYRLALTQSIQGNGDLAEEILEQVITQLEMDVTDKPSSALLVENYGLLAQAYGLKISFSPMKGMFLGPKSAEMLANAKKVTANNPRTLMFEGIADYNTPVMFGGSKQAAISALNEAIENFPADVESGFHWGHAEAYTWRGLAHMELGDKTSAEADWQMALAISPNYGWPKLLLANNSTQ